MVKWFHALPEGGDITLQCPDCGDSSLHFAPPEIEARIEGSQWLSKNNLTGYSALRARGGTDKFHLYVCEGACSGINRFFGLIIREKSGGMRIEVQPVELDFVKVPTPAE